jgi:hypothetical protein
VCSICKGQKEDVYIGGLSMSFSAVDILDISSIVGNVGCYNTNFNANYGSGH